MGDTKTDDNKAAENNVNQNAEETPAPTPKEIRAIVLTGFGGLKAVKVMKKPEPSAPVEEKFSYGSKHDYHLVGWFEMSEGILWCLKSTIC
ncbi:synaptic vesicle membrane protein VAT-1-like [Trichonephila clavata]|uniref:Synaptic vesicle membrane protein VAT-1-like n=1 Tax=Trichonephila clavata TaxID=2740835 RepID=A0A8X6G5C1_TRICU|nr:synaptic vesicle membrane protein VAT-1-like [Trichonephila clavata]